MRAKPRLFERWSRGPLPRPIVFRGDARFPRVMWWATSPRDIAHIRAFPTWDEALAHALGEDA